MKTRKSKPWERNTHYLLTAGHLAELIFAIIIFAAGQSLWTVFVRADPDITPPSVPVGLAVAGRSASEIDLSWTASTDDVGVTGYHVYRDGSLIGSSPTTGYSDTGLVPNTNYNYTVSAYDAANNTSAQSAPLSTATLVDNSPPSTPTNLHQTGSSTNSVTIAWNASSDNVAVTEYDIYRNGSQIKSQTGTSFTDTSLAVYSTYSYTVVAHDAAGNSSSLSVTLNASTSQDTTPPTVPDNIMQTGSTIHSITLTWNNSTDDVGVAGYHVYRDGSLIGSPGGATFTDTNLDVNTSYTYTISAYDAANNASAQSAPYITNSSPDTTPPTIPANLHTTEVLDGSITLAWDASNDNVAVAGYKIYRDGSLVGTSPTPTFKDTELSPVTNYSYTIEAYDAANNVSAASAPLSTQTAYDTTAPDTPANLQSTAQSDTTISLSWNTASDNIAVSGYNLYRNGTLITSTTGTSYIDQGLIVNHDYSYTVQSYDTSNNLSAESSALIAYTTTDTVNPTSPTGLTSPSQTTTTIDLTWSAASDDVAVADYRVYRNASLVATVNALTYSDPGLQYNTHYSYTVAAVDSSGNQSPVSTAFGVSTLPDTTAPVVNVTAPDDGQSVELTFPISATASDDLALSKVDFYVDSTLIQTISSAPFRFNWNSYAVHNGVHSLSAKATDASGNSSSQTVQVTVNNPPPALVGDINNDHKVNLFDLSILLSHWGKTGPGDFNNNGKIDIFDLSVLLSHYGQDDSNYQ